jgi:hypothetical protein
VRLRFYGNCLRRVGWHGSEDAQSLHAPKIIPIFQAWNALGALNELNNHILLATGCWYWRR